LHSLAARITLQATPKTRKTALLRDLSHRDESERVITMHVAPGVSTSIRPEDIVRAERQALTVELWSIPDNA
jgi:hypothetical protein